MARFVLAEDAKAGDVVDLDLNTGKLVAARMAGLGGGDDTASLVRIPTEPPPGLFLRALVTGWRQEADEQWAARPSGEAEAIVATTAGNTLAALAGQLERTLDLMGVASLVAEKIPIRAHVPVANPEAPDVVWCGRCGETLVLAQGPPPYWLTDTEGLAGCSG